MAYAWIPRESRIAVKQPCTISRDGRTIKRQKETACNMELEVTEILEDRTHAKNDFSSKAIVLRVSPQDTANVLQRFAEEVPLNRYGLGHLKRVRRTKFVAAAEAGYVIEVLVCPEKDLCMTPPGIQKLCERNSSIVEVPKYEPVTKEEYEVWNRHWPSNFRPNQLDKERERGFSEEEKKQILYYCNLVDADSQDCSTIMQRPLGGGIIVNPVNEQVVTSAGRIMKKLAAQHGSNALQHPLSDAVMLCIEGVAAAVNDFEAHIGAIEMQPVPEDQYLCTGLDLYLVDEPDIMDAMALVHSRIRRVFFTREDAARGALSSLYRLHCQRDLNHHYRVFHVVKSMPKEGSSTE
jgi:tRNA-specific adenosine deaminase 3